jgi:hypothetical protein
MGRAAVAVIYSCPDCDGDLIDEGFELYCPACERTLSFAQFTGDA